MTSIDPRLADRRKEVAEDRARRNIGRLLRLLAVIAVVGGLVWLFLSPALSAAKVQVEGVSSSRAGEVLVEEQVVVGRPLILIRTGSVEGRLLADPWIKTADLDLDWPDGVVVTIEERVPVAWVETTGGWARRAIDGVALPGADNPDDTLPHINLALVPDEGVYESFEVLGALEFVAALPPTVTPDLVVELRGTELWATVSGFMVRLGRPAEMEAKALALAALLQRDLVAGSEINLIAPTNPAVREPAEPAGEGAGDNSEQP